MKYDFVTIDFETANNNLDSACSIGIVAVRNLQIIDSFYSLIKPNDFYFSENNIKIHGITSDMVETAPTVYELWPKIKHFFSPHVPVVAHNAHFDMSVLHNTFNVDIPDFTYIDSMDIVAPLVGGRRSLSFCCEKLCVNLESHHNACSDAESTAKIVVCGLQSADCMSMWEYLYKFPHINSHLFKSIRPQQKFSKSGQHKKNYAYYNKVRPSDISRTTNNINPDNLLYGKIVVFTGELSIERKEAMQLAVNAGAIVKSSVSGKTNYLIVGRQDINLVGDDGMSTKEEKAYALNSCGKANILIINEQEFLNIIKKDLLYV